MEDSRFLRKAAQPEEEGLPEVRRGLLRAGEEVYLTDRELELRDRDGRECLERMKHISSLIAHVSINSSNHQIKTRFLN